MKAESSSPTQQRKADRYLWYWKPPFNDPKSQHCFNRENWWKKSPKEVFHDAALFELLRRHPAVGELQRKILHMSHEPWPTTVANELVLKGPVPQVVRLENDSLYHVLSQVVLNRSFLRTWRELSEGQRAEFQNSLKAAYPGKGRDLTKGVFDLTEAAQAWAKSEKNVGGPSFDECIAELVEAYTLDGPRMRPAKLKRVLASIAKTCTSDARLMRPAKFKEFIENLAREHASHERLILAVDTEFGSKKEAKAALQQMAGIFWKHQHKPATLVRARSEDWLLVIEAFETEFAKDGDTKFKLGYPPKFKKFLALFESDEARRLCAWWQRRGRSDWAAELNSKSS
jgi:hypothetical protein